MVFHGAGGHAKVVIEAWIASGGSVTGIFDDNESIKTLQNFTVRGKFDAARFSAGQHIISIGVNHIRKKVVESMQLKYGTVIHPNSTMSTSAKIGEGTVVMAHALVHVDSLECPP